MLSELLGELNASHTGARVHSHGQAGLSRRVSLGAFYDQKHTGNGLKIEEILKLVVRSRTGRTRSRSA